MTSKHTGCCELGCSPETGTLLQAFVPIFKREEPRTLVRESGCCRASHCEQNSSAPDQAACSLPYLLWATGMNPREGEQRNMEELSILKFALTLWVRDQVVSFCQRLILIFWLCLSAPLGACAPIKSTSSLLLFGSTGMCEVWSKHWCQGRWRTFLSILFLMDSAFCVFNGHNMK